MCTVIEPLVALGMNRPAVAFTINAIALSADGQQLDQLIIQDLDRSMH